MPATWPRIQFSGSGFGQNGSGWNFGAVCWAAAIAGNSNAAATAASQAHEIAANLSRMTNSPARRLSPAACRASVVKSGGLRKVGGGKSS